MFTSIGEKCISGVSLFLFAISGVLCERGQVDILRVFEFFIMRDCVGIYE